MTMSKCGLRRQDPSHHGHKRPGHRLIAIRSTESGSRNQDSQTGFPRPGIMIAKRVLLDQIPMTGNPIRETRIREQDSASLKSRSRNQDPQTRFPRPGIAITEPGFPDRIPRPPNRDRETRIPKRDPRGRKSRSQNPGIDQ